MSLRLRDHTGFMERLTDFFTELRGGGLMLSPLDQELVRRWSEQQLPLELVCRAVKDAATTYQALHPGLRPPRHLTYYARSVEDAIAAAREKTLGARAHPEEDSP